MHTFEELEVWKLSRELRKSIYALTKNFPGEEKFRLTDQIIRSSRSVGNNIAEGFGRFHHQENIQFCRQARGSLTETLDHLIIALDENYIDEIKYAELKEIIQLCMKLLNGYIAYLKRAKENS